MSKGYQQRDLTCHFKYIVTNKILITTKYNNFLEEYNKNVHKGEILLFYHHKIKLVEFICIDIFNTIKYRQAIVLQ